MSNENGDLELQWLASHPDEVEKYEGKYIAISKDGILGSGDTAGEALENAQKNIPMQSLASCLFQVEISSYFLLDEIEQVPLLKQSSLILEFARNV